jgi:hypothetical protein
MVMHTANTVMSSGGAMPQGGPPMIQPGMMDMGTMNMGLAMGGPGIGGPGMAAQGMGGPMHPSMHPGMPMSMGSGMGPIGMGADMQQMNEHQEMGVSEGFGGQQGMMGMMGGDFMQVCCPLAVQRNTR